MGITIHSIETDIKGGMPHPLTKARATRLHKGVQAAVKRKLQEPNQGRRLGRIETKLTRLNLGLPAHRLSGRAISQLDILAGAGPPRLISATLRL